MRKLSLILFSFFLPAFLLLSSQSANSKVIVKEKTRYYFIKGKSGSELAKSMLTEGPKKIKLRDAIAGMLPEIDFKNVVGKFKNGRCVVESITVTLDITYIYPKWRSKKGASRQLRLIWKQLYAELVKHEKKHAQIARDAAKRLEHAIKQSSGTKFFKCNDFVGSLTMRMFSVVNQMNSRHAAFDRRDGLRSSRVVKLQSALINAK